MESSDEKNIYLNILKLLSARGTRFTTEELARAMGTSKRTIYQHFTSKLDLLEKTIDFVFGDIRRADQTIIASSDIPFQERIRLVFQNIPDGYQIGILIRYADDFHRHYPQLWEKADRAIRAIWDELIEMVEDGIQCGFLRPIDTTVLRTMLEQTLQKLLDYDFTTKQNIAFESGMKAMCDIILFGLLDRPERNPSPCACDASFNLP